LEENTKQKTTNEVSDKIARMLKKLAKGKLQRFNDPIFQSISIKGSGIFDVSEQHDDNLYR